ncbi:MAG: type IV secretion system DNA-binding domain-containing protein [Planctomycetota bacterium]
MVFLKSKVFGGLKLAWNKDAPHAVFIGSPGTGKTLLLRMLMRSVLFDKKGKLAARALVHDPKREMYPVLRGMGVAEHEIRILHPLEARATPWNVAADFRTRDQAVELAHALVRESEHRGDNEFFYNGARSLVQGVISVLQEKAPCRWTLNDVYEICAQERLIRHVLEQSPNLLARLDRYLDGSKTGSSVITTIESELSRLMVVAPANARQLEARGWLDGGGEQGSLRHWFDNTTAGVLLLSAHPDHERAVEPLNNAAIAALARYTLGEPDEPSTHTFFFIDEARTERPLPRLDTLIRQGRSKHAHVTTVFHTYEGMRGVYGDVADEIMGASLNVCVTATNSPATRRWVQALVGVGTGRKVHVAQAYVDAWFNQLGNPSPPYGIDGIFKVPGRSAWYGHSKPRFVDAHLLKHDKSAKDFDHAPLSVTSGLPLGPTDWTDRLSLPPPPPPTNGDSQPRRTEPPPSAFTAQRDIKEYSLGEVSRKFGIL